jgi:hypothetical protein
VEHDEDLLLAAVASVSLLAVSRNPQMRQDFLSRLVVRTATR